MEVGRADRQCKFHEDVICSKSLSALGLGGVSWIGASDVTGGTARQAKEWRVVALKM